MLHTTEGRWSAHNQRQKSKEVWHMKVAIGTHLLCEEIEGILGDGGIERCLMMLGDIEDGNSNKMGCGIHILPSLSSLG